MTDYRFLVLAPSVLLIASMAPACSCNGALSLGDTEDSGVPGDGSEPYLRTDQCGNGLDDDGDGRIDDGCPCGPGEVQSCFGGALAARGVGTCSDGTQTCDAQGSAEWGDWGDSPCVGGALPEEEVCDGRDHDCDGTRDEGCPCTAGEAHACGAEFLVSPCSAGEQACRADGTWSDCEGGVGPTTDICDGVDNDCDGIADVGCGCRPVPERCRDGVDNDCDGIIDEPACTPDWPRDAGVPSPDASIPACDDSPAATGPEWALSLSAVEARDGTTTFGGTIEPSALDVDHGGRLFVAGSICEGSVSIGSTTLSYGPALPFPNHTCNAWVASLGPDGTVLWAWAPTLEPLPDPPRPEDGNPGFGVAALASDGVGGTWFVGRFFGRLIPGAGFPAVEEGGFIFGGDAVLGHLDASGVLTDFRVYGEFGTQESFIGVELASDGDPIVLGASNTVFELGGTLVRTMGGIFLARLDMPSGVAAWVDAVRPTVTSSTMYERHLFLDDLGRPTVVGGSNGAWTFPGATLASTDRDRGQTFVWQTDASDGATLALDSWQATVGYYAHGTKAVRSSLGTVIFGKLRGTIDFGAGPLVSGAATSDSPFGSYLETFDAVGPASGLAIAVPTVYESVSVVPTWNSRLDTVALAASTATVPRSARSDVTTDLGDGPRALREGRLYLVRWDQAATVLEVRDHSAIEGATGDGDLQPQLLEHAPCERTVYGLLGRVNPRMVIRRINY